ncbi:M15 family metallopeptidase [Butyrivibrio sp. INlla14]|uniref:M15 family metallopeptidase n=1 Tax=Butyrivibrio sp. INlla14 TaxID=1520808 RepID=UPI00087603AA|nr:M15 family metallopeptidase [Butyrivibrio sp. INlla14]SCY56445.1 D-alanyl-D-alanine carboxypeptidase [Butyrivibrio sp. INlla14]
MNKKYLHDFGLLCMAIVALSLIARFLAHGQTLAEYEKEKEASSALNSSSAVSTIDDNILDSNASLSEASTASTTDVATIAATKASTESAAEAATDISEQTYAEGFTYSELPQDIVEKISGVSYVDNSNISLDELRYCKVLYNDFDGNVQNGELICNEQIAQDLLEIFYELYNSGYQIESVKLIDEYDGDDTASMLANNTSCFNYRVVEGTQKLSKHAYGLAIDLNPFYNPYITYNKDGSQNISPAGSEAYADRDASFPYKIDENDLAYKLFTEHGFKWGGNWNSVKDYQHFEY